MARFKVQANLALASWEVGDSSSAIKGARQLLRKDSSFLDMRCALTGEPTVHAQKPLLLLTCGSAAVLHTPSLPPRSARCC